MKRPRADSDDEDLDPAALDEAVLIFFHQEASRPSVGKVSDVQRVVHAMKKNLAEADANEAAGINTDE